MSTPLDGTTYPFDPTGKLASNLITGEQQILTAANYRDYHFIVPILAPYFTTSLIVKFQPVDGDLTTLTEGVDYICTHVFHDASLACATPIAGSISFYDTLLTGVVSLQYQTLGGIWTQDDAAIAAILADQLHNPRITTWEQVTEQPVTFPVIDHEWDLVDLIGMSDVVTELQNIEAVLRETGSTGLAEHEADHENPHLVTATQVNLGNVQNYGIATNSDATTGTRNDLYMTPATVAAAIAALPSGGLATHEADHENPHVVTATQLNLGNVQNYGIASTADAQAGTSDSVYMTPLKVATQIGNGFGQDLAEHEDDFGNPHKVDAHQAGTYTSAEIDAFVAAKLDATAQAADSLMLNGNTQAQLTTAILGGTAANTLQFGGQTPADFTASVLSGTAANALTLGGLSQAQIIAAITGNLPSGAAQSTQSPQTTDGIANLWTQLAYTTLPTDGDATTRLPDAQIIVSGGDSYDDAASGLYLVTVSARGVAPNAVTMKVVNMAGVDTGAEFGWVPGTDTNGNATAQIWIKTTGHRNDVVSTELSPWGTVFTTASVSQSGEPAGITYSDEDGFALVSDVVAMVGGLTTAFNNLTASLSGE